MAMEISSKEMEVPPNSIPDPKVDATFRRIPKNAISFSVWRIDDHRLDAEPKANYGVFLDNCAYIIYAAGRVGEFVNKDTLTREPKKGTQLERFIHFWLGSNVSEQTRSNVAHKIQELDSYFGNIATEYRETQNNESARFLSYFKDGLTINSSALLTSKNEVRLYQLYGRKCLRCTEMHNISWEHFNASYVMLLRTQDHLFIWIGRSSSAIERRHALEHATKHYSKNASITIVDDGYEQSMPEDIKALWNLHLPLSARTVSQSVSTTEREQTHKIAIYKCCYRGHRLNLDQLDVLFPSKDELNDSSTVYVLDAQKQGVWLWVGSQATSQDKTNAMGNGRAFVKKKKYPYATPVIRVVEGHEPIDFIRLFPHWHGYDWSDMYIIKPVSTVLGKFDAVTLCQRPKMAAETQLVDDGTGERIVYRITKDQVIELPTAKSTVFTTNNCYVVKYNVVFASVLPADIENVGIKHIIYQWNGAEASTDVITRTEIFARKLFEKIREKVMFVQMSEYDETPNFLQIFDGKLIIMQNEKYIHNNNNNISNNNGTTNDQNATCETLLNQEYYTLKIYGNASYNSKAVEVYPLSSLSSKECYIVKRQHIWVWCGQSSTGDAREVAKGIGNMLGECSLVLEGKEPKEFWLSVSREKSPPVIINGGGGIGVSSNGSNNTCNSSTSSRNSSSNGVNGSISPQSNSSGGGYSSGYVTPPVTTKQRFQSQLLLVWMQKKQFQSVEIMGYEQGDLYPECMYILDAGLVIYVWLGSQINPSERERYMTLAQNYIEQIPLARRPTTALAIVSQNDEPNVFKGFFNEWNNNFWKNYVSYVEKRKDYKPEIEESTNVTNGNTNGVNGNSPLPVTLLNNQKDFDAHQKYPLHVLQMEMDNLPPEINPLRREVHLTHDDFVSIFKMSYFEFDELPAWKQKELKKHNKLF